MRVFAALGLSISLALLSASLSLSQEAKKSEGKKAALTMDQCQKFCDIMSEPNLSADEKANIQYCVRKDFCNFLKADAPPLGLVPLNSRQVHIFWRRLKNTFAASSSQ